MNNRWNDQTDPRSFAKLLENAEVGGWLKLEPNGEHSTIMTTERIKTVRTKPTGRNRDGAFLHNELVCEVAEMDWLPFCCYRDEWKMYVVNKDLERFVQQIVKLLLAARGLTLGPALYYSDDYRWLPVDFRRDSRNQREVQQIAYFVEYRICKLPEPKKTKAKK